MRVALLVIAGCSGGGGGPAGVGGGLYHAIYDFDGPLCGDDGDGDDAWCIEGDRCEDEATSLCAPVSTVCDAPNAEELYDAIYDFDGRICGTTSDGEQAWCQIGDRCVDEEQALCAIVLSPCLDETTF